MATKGEEEQQRLTWATLGWSDPSAMDGTTKREARRRRPRTKSTFFSPAIVLRKKKQEGEQRRS